VNLDSPVLSQQLQANTDRSRLGIHGELRHFANPTQPATDVGASAEGERGILRTPQKAADLLRNQRRVSVYTDSCRSIGAIRRFFSRFLPFSWSSFPDRFLLRDLPSSPVTLSASFRESAVRFDFLPLVPGVSVLANVANVEAILPAKAAAIRPVPLDHFGRSCESLSAFFA
jgi:hypothetical protein